MAEPWSDLPIAARARRTLVAEGLVTLADLDGMSRTQVAALHGMGPKAMGILEAAMRDAGLSFTD